MKYPALLAICFSLTSVTASDVPKLTSADLTPEQMAARQARIQKMQMQRFGGFIVNEPKDNGRIRIVNCQSAVDSAEFSKTSVYFQKFPKLPVYVAKSEWKNRLPTIDDVAALDAKLAVFVIDDPKFADTSLISPEACWAIVNVAQLKKDNPGVDVLAMRTRKFVSRTICQLCGAGGSQYPNTLLSPQKNFTFLDRRKDESLPPDVYSRMARYVKELGIATIDRATYADACEEGWAPAPTNEYQKAIWDKVHAVPKNPMKIEFDPKKGK